MKNKAQKLILGIETSCDDTSVAVLRGKELLSHLSFGQEEVLSKWGGVVPEIAARNHLEKLSPLIEMTLKKSNLEIEDLDLISVTTVPGLLGPLLTGINGAKTLCLLGEKPILPVNHLYAHLEAIHLSEKISYPYLGVLLSGGHSIFFLVESKNQFHVLGSTIDDAAGEAFDKGGKILGLGYPAGHIIDCLAKFGEPNKYEFPIGLQSSADARLSYSGLKTSLRLFCEKNPEILKKIPTQLQKEEPESQEFYNLCASYQNAIVKAVMLKLRYALKIAKEKFQIKQELPIVIGGGVACNSKLREKFQETYPQKSHFVKPEFCTDNGAMIANYGRIHFENRIPFPDCLKIDARGRFINKGEK